MKQPTNRTQMEAFGKVLESIKQRKSIPIERFTSLHAHFQAEDPNGIAWTVGIHTRRWHRLERGRWVQGYPPEALYAEANLIEELQTLARSTAHRFCKQCGAQLLPERKFCGACGAKADAPPAERLCPTCGKAVPAGKRFCAADGTPVSAA